MPIRSDIVVLGTQFVIGRLDRPIFEILAKMDDGLSRRRPADQVGG